MFHKIKKCKRTGRMRRILICHIRTFTCITKVYKCDQRGWGNLYNRKGVLGNGQQLVFFVAAHCLESPYLIVKVPRALLERLKYACRREMKIFLKNYYRFLTKIRQYHLKVGCVGNCFQVPELYFSFSSQESGLWHLNH